MNTAQPHIIKKARICRESPFTGCSLRFYTACGNNRPPSPLELLSRQNYASLVKVWYAQCRQKEKHQNQTNNRQILVFSASDPCGNRTHVNGVRGRCLNRLTNGPYKSRRLPIFTRRFQRTILGTSELNFCVRNGNRWNLTVIVTDQYDWFSITHFCVSVQYFLEGRAFKTE